MISFKFVLALLALILFVLAGLNVSSPRINLVACGLALLTLSMMVTV